MNPHPRPRINPLQLLYRPQFPLPHRVAVQVAGLNAVVETFFKTIKSELIWPVSWQTCSQAENAVARYIDGFYNPIRWHSTLGYKSPVQFEMAGQE